MIFLKIINLIIIDFLPNEENSQKLQPYAQFDNLFSDFNLYI